MTKDDIVIRRATLFCVCVAHVLMPFMMSAVSIALPVMGRQFHATAMQLGLVETIYVLSATIFLLSMGRLADMYGRRVIFQRGLGVFTVMAGLLSMSGSMESVIAMRFVQGIGGSMVMATSMAMVVSVFPVSERGRALGIAVAAAYAGISCGPFFGGLLVSHFGWRSVFLLCVPLGTIAFLLVTFKLPKEQPAAIREPFDWKGSLVYAVSIMILILGASNLDHGHWAYAAIVGGCAGLGLFIWYESRQEFPVLRVSLFKGNRVLAFSNIAALINYAATFGVAFFVSLYLQYIKGMSPSEAGTVMMAQPIVQAALSPFCGRLADRYPADRVATMGMLLCVGGLGLAATIGPQTPLWVIIGMLMLLGMGFALFSSPNTTVIMGSVSPRYLGIASGIVASMRSLGMMTSMTVITVIFSSIMGGQSIVASTYPLFLQSMHTALSVFAIMCGVGVLCSVGRLGARVVEDESGV